MTWTDLLTARQVAEILHCHETQVRRLINNKGLPAIRTSRMLLIPRPGLERWIEQQATSKTAPTPAPTPAGPTSRPTSAHRPPPPTPRTAATFSDGRPCPPGWR